MKRLALALLLAPTLTFAQTEMRTSGRIGEIRITSATPTRAVQVEMQATPRRWLKSVNGEDPRIGGILTGSLARDSTLREPGDIEFGPWARMLVSEVTPLRIELSSAGEGELIVRGYSVEIRGIVTNGERRRFVARGARIQFTRDTLGALMIRAASVRTEP